MWKKLLKMKRVDMSYYNTEYYDKYIFKIPIRLHITADQLKQRTEF